MENQKEIWKEIPNYEGLYQVSNLGRVKSLKRWRNSGNGGYFQKERVMNQTLNPYGYKILGLSKNGYKKTFQVHKLVAMAFLGHEPCGHKIVVDHIDNDKLNNNLSNLQLTTMRHNSSKDRRGGSSKHTGVFWYKARKKWRSYIYINGKRIHLGYFEKELDAHKAYQNALNNIKQ